MMSEIFIRWIGILLFIAISILLVRLFIWLLPILLVFIIAFYIYTYVKDKMNDKDVVIEKANKHKSHKKKNKKIVIIDEEK